MMRKELLIIFVRNPEPGKVKTRLAATIGDEKALVIYRQLLMHTCKATASLPYDKAVFYADKIARDDLWNNSLFQKHLQEGRDLGEKMMNAFKKGFNRGYQKICIIGSDCHELTKDHLENAFQALLEKQVVIGPSRDGGYYLLGMNTFIDPLFLNKKWSTPSVLKDTVKDLDQLRVRYSLIEELNDIDEEKDLPEGLLNIIRKNQS